MKKLSYILLTSLLFTSNAQSQFCCPHFDFFVPSFKGGANFSLTSLLLMQSKLWNLDFAHTGLADSDDRKISALNSNYAFGGYVLGIGYNFACTANDVRVSYLHNRQSGVDVKLDGDLIPLFPIDRPDVFSDVVTVLSGGVPVGTVTVTGPLIEDAQVDFVNANGSFAQDVIDLEFGQTLYVTPNLRFRFFGGLRHAKLHSDFKLGVGLDSHEPITTLLTSPLVNEQVVFDNPSLKFTEDLKHVTNYLGLGPRFGLEANYNIGVGFSLYGSVSTALLIGDIRSSLEIFTNFDFAGVVDDVTLIPIDTDFTYLSTLGDVVVIDNDSERKFHEGPDTRIVPNMEGKLAVSYCFCIPCSPQSRVTFELGYLVDHFWELEDSLDPTTFLSNRPPHRQGVSYDGLYLSAKVQL